MPYSFKASKYSSENATAPKSSIPDAGAIVQVKILSEREAKFDWAGTKERKSSNGNPMWQIHCEVIGDVRGRGAWMIDYVMLDTDRTEQRIGAILDACGFDVSKNLNIEATTLVGKTAFVRVKHETYNGELRAKVAYWIVPNQYAELGLDLPAPSESKDDGDPF